MADKKISELTELTALEDHHYFPVVDLSESAGDDKNQRINTPNLAKGMHDQASGPAFPTQPGYGNNRPFFRTDLGWWCYFDGTRWLTCHTYTTFWSSVGFTVTGTFSAFNPLSSVSYAPYILGVTCATNVVATNDPTKYWSLILFGYNVENTANALIHTFDTSADSPGTRTGHGGTTMSGTAVPANGWSLVWYATKVSTPGNLTLDACVEYRLIVT